MFLNRFSIGQEKPRVPMGLPFLFLDGTEERKDIIQVGIEANGAGPRDDLACHLVALRN
jgi:hypothetical protein